MLSRKIAFNQKYDPSTTWKLFSFSLGQRVWFSFSRPRLCWLFHLTAKPSYFGGTEPERLIPFPRTPIRTYNLVRVIRQIRLQTSRLLLVYPNGRLVDRATILEFIGTQMQGQSTRNILAAFILPISPMLACPAVTSGFVAMVYIGRRGKLGLLRIFNLGELLWPITCLFVLQVCLKSLRFMPRMRQRSSVGRAADL